jgi:hypothetical protein
MTSYLHLADRLAVLVVATVGFPSLPADYRNRLIEIFCGIAIAAFIFWTPVCMAAKFAGRIGWSWWWVFSPWLAALAGYALVYVGAYIFGFLVEARQGNR